MLENTSLGYLELDLYLPYSRMDTSTRRYETLDFSGRGGGVDARGSMAPSAVKSSMCKLRRKMWTGPSEPSGPSPSGPSAWLQLCGSGNKSSESQSDGAISALSSGWVCFGSVNSPMSVAVDKEGLLTLVSC